MFKKKSSVDILDIPDLHRRKLIDLPEEKDFEKTKITNDGFLEISKGDEVSSSSAVNSEDKSATSFLNDFASIGSSKTENTESKSEDKVSQDDLKWRIENLEYKLEQLTEKFNSLNDSSSK